MINKKRKTTIGLLIEILFVVSLLLANFNIRLFLTISPCMIIGILAFFYNIYYKNITLENLNFKKKNMVSVILFLLTILLSCIFAYNPTQSLKIFFKFGIIFFCFIQFNIIYRTLDKTTTNSILNKIFILYGILSLIYYIAGIVSLNFNFNIENIKTLGVMVDRHIPRLISFASDDPNISAIYFSIILAFFIPQNKTKRYFLKIILFSILIILTFSRGGLIAFALLIIVNLTYYVLSKKKYKIGIIILIAISIFIPSCIFIAKSEYGSQTILGTIVGRFEESISDGGSGRLRIWSKSIETFLKNPVTGIGANNTLLYNTEQYKLHKYTHNSYLEILSETGIIGSLTFVLLLFNILKSNIKKSTQTIFPLSATVVFLTSILFLSLIYTELFITILSIALFNWNRANEKTK